MDPAAHRWRPLGRLLVDSGVLTETQLERALEEQRGTGKRLGSVLVELELVTSEALEHVLMEQMGFDLSTQSGFGYGLRAELARRGSRSVREPVRLGFVKALAPERPQEPMPDAEESPSPAEEPSVEPSPEVARRRRPATNPARAVRLEKALAEFHRAAEALQPPLSLVRTALTARQ